MDNIFDNTKLLELQKQQVIWECVAGETDTYDGVPYTHRGYGSIEPIYSQILKRYRRDACPCEKEAREQHKRTQEARACKRRQEAFREETYGWLGKQWADVGLDKKSYSNFDGSKQPNAIASMQAFQDIMRGTLILHGPFGTGKTHLLAALCNAMHAGNTSCLFASATKLFSAIQDLIGRNESYMSLLNRAMRTPLLALDDIDKATPSNFRQEIYFSIIDERTRRELPTAISTNRIADLESFVGGAVYSRLKIGQIAIELTGSDHREEL